MPATPGGIVSTDSISGIPRLELHARPVWKRNLAWWAGGNIFATRTGLALWRRFGAPMEARIVEASGGRLRLQPAFPVVMLTTNGARSGQRREIPLAYFTDGEDVILIASNYGSERHPAWYHNLVAHPECELHIGPRGGDFIAREATGADRDRLYSLASQRLAKVFELHQERSGPRNIPVMRLSSLPA